MWLYSDEAFTNWAANISDSNPDLEQTFKNRYSDYTLAMVCDISALLVRVDRTYTTTTDADGNDVVSHTGTDYYYNLTDGSKANWGCCLQDKSQKGGGYCMAVNDAEDDIDSFYVYDSEFATLISFADPISNRPSTCN